MNFLERIQNRFRAARMVNVDNHYIFIPLPISYHIDFGENKKRFKRKMQFNKNKSTF